MHCQQFGYDDEKYKQLLFNTIMLLNDKDIQCWPGVGFSLLYAMSSYILKEIQWPCYHCHHPHPHQSDHNCSHDYDKEKKIKKIEFFF